jgi:hypothetical protein
MDRPRRRFVIALGVFLGWVALLGALIALEGRTPPQSAEPAEPPVPAPAPAQG